MLLIRAGSSKQGNSVFLSFFLGVLKDLIYYSKVETPETLLFVLFIAKYVGVFVKTFWIWTFWVKIRKHPEKGPSRTLFYICLTITRLFFPTFSKKSVFCSGLLWMTTIESNIYHFERFCGRSFKTWTPPKERKWILFSYLYL